MILPDEPHATIALTVNGTSHRALVPLRLGLADFLRDELGLTGLKLGCEEGQCGSCTLRLDGEIVRGCTLLAVQANGCQVETIEGTAKDCLVRDLQQAFLRHGALQCGFCSAGIVLTAAAALQADPDLDRAGIRAALTGNICRCTGYQPIVDAIEDVAKSHRETIA